jgi:hypothetical protein
MPSCTESLAATYVDLLAAESPSTAEHIRRIGRLYGARPAYLAGITLVDGGDSGKGQTIASTRLQRCEFFAKEYPEAVPLLQAAIEQFVRVMVGATALTGNQT